MGWSDDWLSVARGCFPTDARFEPPRRSSLFPFRGGNSNARLRPFPDCEPGAVLGHNPAHLGCQVYVSDRLIPKPALVVLLHGCQQEAASFALESGWVAQARRSGAVLLLPEQNTTNNSSRCFNWFKLAEGDGGTAELRSIKAMMDTACAVYGCDLRQVFVVGLSAGGAMAAALMAAFPEFIAAGAVVAGLPVGCARSMGEALGRMASAGPLAESEEWARRARSVGPPGYRGAWPRLSVWHGDADQTVDPANADLLVKQWGALHGLDEVPAQDIGLGGKARQRRWQRQSLPILEWWCLPGFEHGYPNGMSRPGGRWVLPSAVDASGAIAGFFGLEQDLR